jgi:glutamyl/glutaminyl-tRNA synthetase
MNQIIDKFESTSSMKDLSCSNKSNISNSNYFFVFGVQDDKTFLAENLKYLSFENLEIPYLKSFTNIHELFNIDDQYIVLSLNDNSTKVIKVDKLKLIEKIDYFIFNLTT